jgi:hypothetical protein
MIASAINANPQWMLARLAPFWDYVSAVIGYWQFWVAVAFFVERAVERFCPKIWRWAEPILTLERRRTLFVWIAVIAFGYANFRAFDHERTKASHPPKLDTAGPRILLNATAPIVRLDYHNSGSSTAKRGAVRLIGLNDGKTSRRELGKADIIGAGTNVLPNYNGQAEIEVSGELPDLFLACTVYYDDDNQVLKKAFLFRIGTTRNNEVPLNEIETPDYNQVCAE